jgi:ABC-2 type transport system permease protein
MGIKKYFDVWRVNLKNNWVRAVVYRTNFITAFIVDLVWILVEFALFSVIYANTPRIAGWTKPQVFFFLGVFFVGDALFTVFFQTNFWRFSDLVNKGELDILLTKPIHPLFLALTRWVNLTALLNVILGIAIIIRYSEPAGFQGGINGVLILIFWILLGLSINVLVRFLFSVVIFWTDRGFALSRLYYQFYQIATKPDVIYPSMIRYVILTALPFAFVGSVPVRAVLFGLQSHEYLLILLSLSSFFFLNQRLWRAGLRRYQSASS